MLTFPSLDPGHDQGRKRREVEGGYPDRRRLALFSVVVNATSLQVSATGEERHLCLIWMVLVFDFMSAAFIVDMDSCCCGSLNPGCLNIV